VTVFGEHFIRSRVWGAALAVLFSCGGAAARNSGSDASALLDGYTTADGPAGQGCSNSSSSSSGLPSDSACDAGLLERSQVPYVAPDGGPYQCLGECPAGPARPNSTARPVCPNLEPLLSAACYLDAGTVCSYGDDPRTACRHVYTCSKGNWTAMFTWSCPAITSYCPATAPAQQSNCMVPTDPSVPCVFGDLSCYCGSPGIAAGTAAPWICYGPPANPACPAIAPNIGDGCSTQALECWYAPTGCDTPNSYVFCRNGQWEMEQGPPCAGL
jgi:hypothetical protein